jgi:hypothetical protein
VPGLEDCDRPTVERGNTRDPQALGSGDQNGVREARPVFIVSRSSSAARARSAWVGATTLTAPLWIDSSSASVARSPSSRWSSRSSSAKVSAPIISGSLTRPNQASAAR